MILSLVPLLWVSTLMAQPPADPSSAGTPATVKDPFKADPSWKSLGDSLWFDAKARRLVMRCKVVLREGPLEHLLCLRGTKEHEAILATSAAPKSIHAGLLLTGAEPGHPVRFLPKFEPPAGTEIRIDLEWEEQGKMQHADARDWVFNEKTKKALDTDWVFAGSEIVTNPVTKELYYTAQDGDLITVANFGNAILDLPYASTAADADRVYVANSEKIPARGTFVTMSFTPQKPSKTQPNKPDQPR